MRGTSWLRFPCGLSLALLALLETSAAAQAPLAPSPTPAQLLATVLAAQPPLLQAVGPQAGFGDLLVLGNGARFELSANAAGHRPVMDGAPIEVAALAGPWTPGRHAVSLQSPAQAGVDPAVQPALQFVYDPGAPTIRWEVGNTNLLDTYGLDQDVDREKPPRHVIPERAEDVKILWSPDGRRWLPLLAKDAKPDATGALADWLTAADRPQVFLWALGEQVFDHGAPVAPRKMELVRVWAGDELSAVRDLRMRVLPAGGAYRLEMVATDLVGNRSTVTWPLRP
jgi:hypothetical protein